MAVEQDLLKSIVTNYLNELKENNNTYFGYIEGEENHENFMTELSAGGFSFVTRSSKSHATETDKGKFWFQNPSKDDNAPGIPFCGSPFQIVQISKFHCTLGKRYKKLPPERAAEIEDESNLDKKQSRIPISRKLGCPAKMTIRSIRVFPDFITDEGNWRQRNKVMKELKSSIKAGTKLKTIQRYYVSISSASQHTHDEMSAMIGRRLHPSLVEEIHKLVQNKITSNKHIKLHLESFVEEKFKNSTSKPSLMNSSFYPSKKAIADYTADALVKVKKSAMDQHALQIAVQTWKTASNDLFFFQPHVDATEEESSSSLIFCHQTKWQQQILSRYGNHMCLLDATYKTAKYSVPLFFLFVKTNIDYCVVATFVIEHENQGTIQEALEVIKLWNPKWRPKNFMTDFSECEIKALELVFPQCKVCICSFHRERCWIQWLAESKNVNEEDAAVLEELWKAIACARMQEEYERRLEDLHKSDCWKNCERARRYFSSQWLSNRERWVDAFYSKELYFNIRANNGIEAQNHLLKNSYLNNHSDKTLTSVLTIIVEELLPDQYRKYCRENTKLSANYKMYHDIPSYLHERPPQFVNHMMNRLEKAKLYYSGAKIQVVSDGLFLVESEDHEDVWYVVTFEPVCCSCTDFSKWQFPCKHFCAIFLYVPCWSFEKLTADYTQSVFLAIDPAHGYTTCALPSNKDNASSSEDCKVIANRFHHPVTDTPLGKLQESVREILKRSVDLTYLCQDEAILETIKADAESIRCKLEEGVSTDCRKTLKRKYERSDNKLPEREKMKKK